MSVLKLKLLVLIPNGVRIANGTTRLTIPTLIANQAFMFHTKSDLTMKSVKISPYMSVIPKHILLTEKSSLTFIGQIKRDLTKSRRLHVYG